MTRRKNISTYISSLAISLLLLSPTTAQAQKKVMKTVASREDSIPLFRGFAVSVDAVGPIQMAVSDYGQYEAALRLNLKDKYFPIIELGLGKAEHNDDVTLIHYKTSAPYGKIGVDFNMMKNKHDFYRLLCGVRYAFTSFKYDVSHPDIQDPVWGNIAKYDEKDVKASYHWMEFVFGVDARIWGPLHLGWSVRYRKRITCDEGALGNCWYVPGYGKSDTSQLGGTFNIIFDI